MRLVRLKKKTTTKAPVQAAPVAPVEAAPDEDEVPEVALDAEVDGEESLAEFEPESEEFAVVAKVVKNAARAKAKAKTSGSSSDGDRDQSLFRRYLRDVNGLDVMAPEQEFAMARQIESLKLQLWYAILGHGPAGALIVEAVERLLETKFPDWDAYKELVFKDVAAAVKPKASATGKTAKPTKAAAGKKATSGKGEAPVRSAALEKLLQSFADAAGAADPEGTAVENIVDFMTDLPPSRTAMVSGFDAYMAGLRIARARLRLAKNDFVSANLRLVVAVAARYSRELLTFEDLVQEGNIGLMKAVDRFDYRKGFRFSTYASWWIRHAIGRALADKARLVRLPVHVLDAQQKVEKTRRALTAQLGRKPTPAEIAKETGLDVEEVERINALPSSSPLSLDEPFSDEDDDRSRMDTLADPEPGPEPVDRLAQTETERAMISLMAQLKPVEVDILRKRFGLHDGRERTLQEIGDEHRLSRERIRQVQDRALNKLRGALNQYLATGNTNNNAAARGTQPRG
ncbi:MAG: sigma-70 family RNA polymerase sigma factor [Deltaproteobacteria bacterium]|nr:sigma-70 family RNA polymerase sigma factor [Deltaproteobacteria bacterium]